MKKIVSLLMLINLIFAGSLTQRYLTILTHMNQQQIDTFKFVWYNAKRVDLQYTLTAIALVESELGKHKLNLSDPSCGIFHKLPMEYLKEEGIAPTLWNASRYCEKLMNNDAFSYKVAERDFLKYLSYWIKRGKPYSVAWKYAIMSYNAGYYFYGNKNRKKKAMQYYNRVRSAIRAIRIFINRIHIKDIK